MRTTMQILEDVRYFGWLQQHGIIADPARGTGDRLTFAVSIEDMQFFDTKTGLAIRG